ncbi:MAG: hypothetical protein ACRDNB_00020 [Gaiellaceae bacterium]
MQDERDDGDVIVDIVFDRGLLFLVLMNLGDRPAHRVRVKFDRDFRGLGGGKRMHRLALFRRLEFLAPRKSIEVFLDRSDSYFARGEPTELTATIAWRTPEGARRTTIIHHDLEIYRDLGFVEREVPPSGRPA